LGVAIEVRVLRRAGRTRTQSDLPWQRHRHAMLSVRWLDPSSTAAVDCRVESGSSGRRLDAGDRPAHERLDEFQLAVALL
jgi:hypothetical protein